MEASALARLLPSRPAVSEPVVEGPRAPKVYDFGEFSFDERRLVLCREGERIRLPRRVLEVLAVLLRSNGALVSREELMAEVWQGAHVEAGVLTQAVFLLRKALGDNPAEPRFVATLQGRGYAFLGAVARVEESSRELGAPAPKTLRGRRPHWIIAAGLAAAALLATHSWSPASRPASPAPTIEPTAYERYLEARHLLSQRNERGLSLALAYFQQTLEHAPAYAPAHAGLAEAEILMGAYEYGTLAPRARYERARLSARRAVELD